MIDLPFLLKWEITRKLRSKSLGNSFKITRYQNFLLDFNCLRLRDKKIFSILNFQVVKREASGEALLAAHYRVDGHPFINPIQARKSLNKT